MALFSGKDKDLPLLTQVYQLNLEDEAEIRRFCEAQGYAECVTPEDARLVAVAGKLVRPMMLSLVEQGGIKLAQLEEFNEIRHMFDGKVLMKYYTEAPGFVPLSNITFIDNSMDTTGKRILRAMQAAMEAMQKIPDFLSPCEECDNIFERSKARQRFCSNRCSGRARLRRWRGEKK